jgi:hypothetical protein
MNRAAIALVLLALAQPGVGQVQEDERARRAELARVRKAQGEGDPGVADAVIGLASSLEAQGRTRAVEDLYRLEIDVSRKNADKGNTRVLSLAFTEWLLRVRRAADAELIARGAFELGRQSLAAGDWRLSDARSLIGETLVAQKKFAAAESLLVEAQKELAAAVEAPADTRKRAIRRLVDLYEAWERTSPGQGKMAEAARWRTRL